ncbi:hypothetical protein HZA38_00545 [Candidatus Peregrinibacteria bacterium]|nr:hypothetical protein [Candidatus Peregrinibacteria bacterium]
MIQKHIVWQKDFLSKQLFWEERRVFDAGAGGEAFNAAEAETVDNKVEDKRLKKGGEEKIPDEQKVTAKAKEVFNSLSGTIDAQLKAEELAGAKTSMKQEVQREMDEIMKEWGKKLDDLDKWAKRGTSEMKYDFEGIMTPIRIDLARYEKDESDEIKKEVSILEALFKKEKFEVSSIENPLEYGLYAPLFPKDAIDVHLESKPKKGFVKFEFKAPDGDRFTGEFHMQDGKFSITNLVSREKGNRDIKNITDYSNFDAEDISNFFEQIISQKEKIKSAKRNKPVEILYKDKNDQNVEEIVTTGINSDPKTGAEIKFQDGSMRIEKIADKVILNFGDKGKLRLVDSVHGSSLESNGDGKTNELVIYNNSQEIRISLNEIRSFDEMKNSLQAKKLLAPLEGKVVAEAAAEKKPAKPENISQKLKDHAKFGTKPTNSIGDGEGVKVTDKQPLWVTTNGGELILRSKTDAGEVKRFPNGTPVTVVNTEITSDACQQKHKWVEVKIGKETGLMPLFYLSKEAPVQATEKPSSSDQTLSAVDAETGREAAPAQPATTPENPFTAIEKTPNFQSPIFQVGYDLYQFQTNEKGAEEWFAKLYRQNPYRNDRNFVEVTKISDSSICDIKRKTYQEGLKVISKNGEIRINPNGKEFPLGHIRAVRDIIETYKTKELPKESEGTTTLHKNLNNMLKIMRELSNNTIQNVKLYEGEWNTYTPDEWKDNDDFARIKFEYKGKSFLLEIDNDTFGTDIYIWDRDNLSENESASIDGNGGYTDKARFNAAYNAKELMQELGKYCAVATAAAPAAPTSVATPPPTPSS